MKGLIKLVPLYLLMFSFHAHSHCAWEDEDAQTEVEWQNHKISEANAALQPRQATLNQLVTQVNQQSADLELTKKMILEGNQFASNMQILMTGLGDLQLQIRTETSALQFTIPRLNEMPVSFGDLEAAVIGSNASDGTKQTAYVLFQSIAQFKGEQEKILGPVLAMVRSSLSQQGGQAIAWGLEQAMNALGSVMESESPKVTTLEGHKKDLETILANSINQKNDAAAAVKAITDGIATRIQVRDANIVKRGRCRPVFPQRSQFY